MEWLSQINTTLGVVISLISAVAFLVSFIIALVQAIKGKKYSEIAGLVEGFIQDAEKLVAKDGETPVSAETKKEVVLAKTRMACSQKKYKFNADQWSDFIEEKIDFSKNVNQRDKDKTTVEEKSTTTETTTQQSQTSTTNSKVNF